jgi:hypothetical protein
VIDIKVTTKVVKIADVLIEAPIEAIKSGKKTTDGIDLKKLIELRVIFSPEFQSVMDVPITNARKVPRRKPRREIANVINNDFQKKSVKVSGTRSRITNHECGKLSTPAIAEAASQRIKLTAVIASHF